MSPQHKTFASPLTIVFLLGLILTVTGCGKHKALEIKGYQLKPFIPSSRFIAGAGQEEITPYVGIPMGGHGPGGRIARGTWMPLYARAFYFQDARGHSAAMVSCDLFAVSGALREKVLSLVNAKVRLEPNSLILSATHTHHGPGNFTTTDVYDLVGGPLPNFDEKVFCFIAERIARAVVAAIDDAHSHANDDHELLLYSGYAVGIQRNRAIAPFYENNGLVQQVQRESSNAGSVCPDGGKNCIRYLSTDPTLKTLEIRRAGKTAAVLVFYAVHPTAMTHDAELYSPDLTGFAMRQIELCHGIVSGFFNGAEGDVSPDWDRQDRDDVIKLGRKLTVAVSDLLKTTPVARSREINIEMKWNRARQKSPEWKMARFSDTPTPGAANVGGAEDGRTVFYNYGFRGEARKSEPGEGCKDKDPKLSALQDPLKNLVDALQLGITKPLVGLAHNSPSPKSFPMEFPVAHLSLLPVASFASVPVEPTTLVGRRIRESVGRDTIVLGLSNEYFSYAVTPEEYCLQQYEGASTELGPNEMDGILYLLQHVDVVEQKEFVPGQSFNPGARRNPPFGPDLLLLRVPRNMIDDDLQPLYPSTLRRYESRIPRFEWHEDPLADDKPEMRRVSVYSEQTVIADDRKSSDLLTVFDGEREQKKKLAYVGVWLPPDSTSSKQYFYFRVQTGDGKTVCSKKFTLETLEDVAPPKPREPGQCPAH